MGTNVQAKRLKVVTVDDFFNYLSSNNTVIIENKIDLKGRTIILGPNSTLQFKKGGALYNGSISIREKCRIKDGFFIVNDDYSLNDVIIVRGNGCRISNTVIDGGNSRTRFGITVFESVQTNINNCIIKNIGTGENNTAGIRMQGNCSNSVIDYTSIDNITATTNASGIVIQSSDNGNNYSNEIKITNCRISRITPEADGDGIKILQNHKNANHIIKNCEFVDCAKRAIKIQGFGVRCISNYVNGGCSESVIDYQNGDCHINGLEAINLGYVYAGIYIQGSGGSIYINKVDIKADNTEKQYVKGIKIKRADWDNNNRIKKIDIRNCNISNFYQAFSIEGFDFIEDVRINDCFFSSVSHPFYIGTHVEKLSVLQSKDRNIGGDRSSVFFPSIETCKESKIDIKVVRE